MHDRSHNNSINITASKYSSNSKSTFVANVVTFNLSCSVCKKKIIQCIIVKISIIYQLKIELRPQIKRTFVLIAYDQLLSKSNSSTYRKWNKKHQYVVVHNCIEQFRSVCVKHANVVSGYQSSTPSCHTIYVITLNVLLFTAVINIYDSDNQIHLFMPRIIWQWLLYEFHNERVNQSSET